VLAGRYGRGRITGGVAEEQPQAGRGRAVGAGGGGRGGDGEIAADLAGRVDEYRSQLIEAAAESDDSLLEKYLDAGTLSEEEIQRGLREGILEGKVAPVVCCSATKLLGVRTLLSTIAELMPRPEVEPEKPAKAFVFNTGGDQFGRVSYFKVVAGTVKADAHLPNLSRGGEERLAQIFFPRGKEHVAATEIRAGDIGAVTKLTHTLTGDTLGLKDGGPLPPLDLPGPAFSLAITPKARGDEEKISSGLARLSEEDPTLHVERSEETHQLVIAGPGDVHLDVTLEKLKRKYGVEATTAIPRVPYRETVHGQARAEGRHVKQSGGHGQYGICVIEVEPTARGEGFVWEDKIFGGSIPKEYIPSVEYGARMAAKTGVLASYPLINAKITLVDGSYHPVDSSQIAFELAGQLHQSGLLVPLPLGVGLGVLHLLDGCPRLLEGSRRIRVADAPDAVRPERDLADLPRREMARDNVQFAQVAADPSVTLDIARDHDPLLIEDRDDAASQVCTCQKGRRLCSLGPGGS